MTKSGWKLEKEDWSYLRVGRLGVSQAVIVSPLLPTTTGHLLPDTPLFITLWGEISLLHSHVSCKTIPSSTFTKFTWDQHSCQLCIFHWFTNIILLSKSFTNVNAPWFFIASPKRIGWIIEGRWSAHWQVFSSVFPCFPSSKMFSLVKNVFSHRKCFRSYAKTLSASCATIEGLKTTLL